MTGGKGKWAPKLTFDERCGFYYALVTGVDKRTVELASGLNRGTITRLADKRYKAYGAVRQKLDELGLDAFREQYYSEQIQARLAAAVRAQVAGPRGAVHPPQCTD